MDIITGNKLIAEFDDGVRIEPYQNWKFKDIRSYGYTTYRDEELQYHSSWSWLMPIIEKISTYHYPEYYGKRGKTEDDGDYDDCAYPRTFGMRDKEGKYMVRINANTLHSANTLIEATWMAVIDFIQWYNNQPLK